MNSIADLTQHLRGQWQLLQVEERQLAERWRDATYWRFHRAYWVSWESRLPELLTRLESLDEVIRRSEETTREW